MTETYSTYEAKAKLSEILRKVERGQIVLISRHGEPIAEVRPIASRQVGLEQRIADLVDHGVVVEAKGRAATLEPIARIPGALERFLATRD